MNLNEYRRLVFAPVVVFLRFLGAGSRGGGVGSSSMMVVLELEDDERDRLPGTDNDSDEEEDEIETWRPPGPVVGWLNRMCVASAPSLPR